MDSVKLAVVQRKPAFLDRSATVELACDIIAEAGRNGASLVLFPETFIPTYPNWVWAVPPRENSLLSEMYADLVANSITVPGKDIDRLCAAARSAGVFAAVGISEVRTDGSGTSLFNSLLSIDAHGTVLGSHRKLVPTGPERMVWTQGDGSTLHVFETPFGNVGGLICWENYMPLARYAMYAWGTQIYLAPTWDSGEPWLSTIRHIAKEGRVYVLSCCIPMQVKDMPEELEARKFYGGPDDWINAGDSAIVDPDGKFIAGPSSRKEEILYAEIDPRKATGSRWKLDVAGHYGRPDVFQLTVRRSSHPMIVSTTKPDEAKDPERVD
jgi:nitrilase